MSKSESRKSPAAARADTRSFGEGGPGRAEAVLAAAWLLVPAAQYVCSDQRMRLITGDSAPLERWALTDLTVGYLVLLVATVIHTALSVMRNRGRGAGQ